MSGERRRSEAPQGPPWPPELLAELHAGALAPQEAEELRARAHDDDEARAVLAALDSAGEDLNSLPAPTVPDDVAARLDAALDAEVRAMRQHHGGTGGQETRTRAMPAAPVAQEAQSPVGTPTPEAPTAEHDGAEVVDLAAARNRRRRRFGLGAGLLAAAAATTGIVVFTAMPGDQEMQAGTQHPPTAQPQPESSPPLALSSSELSPPEFQEVFRSDQLGTLSDPQKLIGCLQANGIDSGKPLAARTVTIDGRPGQMLVLPAGRIGEFRLLTVGPDCGPGNPATISDSTFGG